MDSKVVATWAIPNYCSLQRRPKRRFMVPEIRYQCLNPKPLAPDSVFFWADYCLGRDMEDRQGKNIKRRVLPGTREGATILPTCIENDADEHELLLWKRVLLSFPAFFNKFESDDALYWKCTNLRVQFMGVARAVKHQAAQLVIDIYTYKLREEAALGSLTPAQVAELYNDNLDGNIADDIKTRSKMWCVKLGAW